MSMADVLTGRTLASHRARRSGSAMRVQARSSLAGSLGVCDRSVAIGAPAAASTTPTTIAATSGHLITDRS
jgi:hypothetical protein